MKAIAETISIGHEQYDEHGQRLEPEEQPATVTIASEAQVSIGHGPSGGAPIGGRLRVNLSADMTAQELADLRSHACSRCHHWRPDETTAAIGIMRSDPDGRRLLDRTRAELIAEGVADLENADQLLATFGVCKALSEITREPVLTHPDGCCPRDLDLFAVRGDERKAATAIRDHILKIAQGKG